MPLPLSVRRRTVRCASAGSGRRSRRPYNQDSTPGREEASQGVPWLGVGLLGWDLRISSIRPKTCLGQMATEKGNHLIYYIYYYTATTTGYVSTTALPLFLSTAIATTSYYY